jgi:hypothetical protein
MMSKKTDDKLRYQVVSSELINYLLEGNDDFRNFKVPKTAQMLGILAEEEIDLALHWSHECEFSSYRFNQVYGPKVENIDRIECVNMANGEQTVWSTNRPQFQSFTLPNDPDEAISIYFDVEEHNLLIFELEKGCWTYECNYELNKPINSSSELKTVETNCSFGENVDSIVDGVCAGFVFDHNLFVLSAAETDNLGNHAIVYEDDL